MRWLPGTRHSPQARSRSSGRRDSGLAEHGRDEQLLAPELFDRRVAQSRCVGIAEDAGGARQSVVAGSAGRGDAGWRLQYFISMATKASRPCGVVQRIITSKAV